MSDWQPIETAPRDGRPILIWQPDKAYQPQRNYDDWRYAIGYWRTDEKIGSWGNRNSAVVTPTYWMPLPPPPRGVESGSDIKP